MFASSDKPAEPVDVNTLHAKIAQLTLDNDFLAGALGRLSRLSIGTGPADNDDYSF